jgi:hypothetical protein
VLQQDIKRIQTDVAEFIDCLDKGLTQITDSVYSKTAEIGQEMKS